MMLKTNILALLSLFSCIGVDAKDARSFWQTMPDSVVQAIDKVRRLEMLDLVDYKVRAEVDNRLGSQSVMDTITADYLHVSISKSSELSVRVLPLNSGDTVACVVHTYSAPQAESTVRFYDTSWHRLDAARFLPFTDINAAAEGLVLRPDTMSQQRYDELVRGFVAVMVSAKTSVESRDIVLSAAVPMVGKEDGAAVASLLRNRRLVWTGSAYEFASE